jgi:nuclear pore complex protein Nup62
MLISSKITALHRQVLEAQQNQAAVDQALGYIESQQRQLDSVLTHYEREVKSFTSDGSKPLSAKLPADREREKSCVLPCEVLLLLICL